MASPRGTYLIIADALRLELRSERPPEVLPSEAELMRRHGVSRTTVRRALGALAEEGLVESVPGKGWSVRQASGTGSIPLVERVLGIIETDELKVGDRFPSEARLTERFSASRGAVRHALAQLEGQGILVSAHGKGRTVQAAPEPRERKAEC